MEITYPLPEGTSVGFINFVSMVSNDLSMPNVLFNVVLSDRGDCIDPGLWQVI